MQGLLRLSRCTCSCCRFVQSRVSFVMVATQEAEQGQVVDSVCVRCGCLTVAHCVSSDVNDSGSFSEGTTVALCQMTCKPGSLSDSTTIAQHQKM